MAYVKPRKVKNSAHIESIIHTANLKNGQWVNLGIIDEDNGDEAVKVTLGVEKEEAEGLLVTEHINYGFPDYNYAEQETKAGKLGRVYLVETGNHFSFSKDLVSDSGTIAIGDDVTVGVGGLGIRKAELAEAVVGKLIGKEFDLNMGELYIVRIK